MKKPEIKLWSYLQYYKFNSILLRNFILIMTLIIVPLVGISVFVHGHSDANMRAEIERSAMSQLARTRDSVDMILSEAERLSVRLKSDPDVTLLLSQQLSSPLNYNDAQRILRIQQVLQTVYLTSPYIDSIFIYSELNDFMVRSGAVSSQSSPYFIWWPELYNEGQNISHYWRAGHSEEGTLPLLSFVNRQFPAPRDGTIGIVSINMNMSELGGLMDGSIQQQTIFLLDAAGKIMYNQSPNKLNQTLDQTDPGLLELLERDLDSRIVELNGQHQVVSLLPSLSLNGWDYVSLVSLQLYESEQSRIMKLLAILLAVSVSTSVLLAFIIAARSYRPIHQILSLIENKDNPFIMLTKSSDKQWNETRYILSNLTESFHRNQSMEIQIQEKYELLRKAQAIALQAQINPHFLFNTLESVNWKVMRLTNGKNEASQMLLSLSALLRLTLETEEDLVPIRTELEHVKLYVEMQKLRYKDKVALECVVEEKLLNCKIVKLVLQPLVENAIYYGIKQSPHNGRITIRGFARKDVIVILVRDNGVGISQSTVFELNDSFKKNHLQENKHIGLRNVNQRLRLTFGEKYGLSVRSRLGVGTIVEMTIPMLDISQMEE